MNHVTCLVSSVSGVQLVQSLMFPLMFIFLTRPSLSDPQTYIGSILAAVNPYQQLPGLYDRPAVETYSRHHLGEISPHIFALANECYRSLWKRLQSQCVLIRWEIVSERLIKSLYRSLIKHKQTLKPQ